MALRLRRGTDAQRLLITPAEGELIYTTDTKSLYVGDGTTVGGLIVTAGENINLGELNDVDLITNPPATNQVLKWNGVKWVPADDIGEDLVDYIIKDGHDFRINIVALDSTRMVDIAENKFTGDLYGDVYDPTTEFKVVENVARWGKLDIRADDDTVILQHNTGSIFDAGGNLLVDGGLRVFYGDVDGGVRGDVVDVNLNTIINHITHQIYGDLTGSVFADDSSLVIDGITGTIHATNFAPSTSTATFESGDNAVQNTVNVISADEQSNLVFTRKSNADLSADNALVYGSIRFDRNDVNGTVATGIILDRQNSLLFGSSATGDLANGSNFMAWTEQKLGIGTTIPSATLDVQGAIMPGVYADAAARDAAIPTPVAGMMVYVTDVNKHQGYNGTTWSDFY